MKSVKRVAIGFALFFLPVILNGATSKAPLIIEKLKYQKMVNRFYEIKGETLFWFNNGESISLRKKAKMIFDSVVYLGLNKEQYHYKWICANVEENDELNDSLMRITADKIFTDAMIGLCKDLYGGDDIAKLLSYDELSQKVQALDDTYILMGLSSVSSPIELEWFVRFLEPVSENYILMKQELRHMVNANIADTINQLNESLNLMRWINHFKFNKFVVVNTASAVLRYYVSDTVSLQMKVVVGKQETPTPRFAGFCDQVILYPYWNVPYSIAVKEMLPLIKRNRSYLDTRNLQVINKNGNIIDPQTINWSSLSARNFPYQLRQSTGCDNALGVIKFNLTDPFSVYMHDTNSKTAFLAGARFFSHGCIRLEKPVELASMFIPGKIDADFLQACEHNQKPVPLSLAEPVPVFVVYMTAELNVNGDVKYYKDVYNQFR